MRRIWKQTEHAQWNFSTYFRVFRLFPYVPRSTVIIQESRRTLFQRFLNRLRHLFALGFFPGVKAGDDLSIAVNQEFVEVPADVSAEFRIGLFAGQEFVKRMNLGAFDRDFGEHRE